MQWSLCDSPTLQKVPKRIKNLTINKLDTLMQSVCLRFPLSFFFNCAFYAFLQHNRARPLFAFQHLDGGVVEKCRFRMYVVDCDVMWCCCCIMTLPLGCRRYTFCARIYFLVVNIFSSALGLLRPCLCLLFDTAPFKRQDFSGVFRRLHVCALGSIRDI